MSVELKKPNLHVFVAILETLSEQGFIDVEPTEGEYDCTKIYDFLVASGIALRVGGSHYWLQLNDESLCQMLINILKGEKK